MGASPWRRRLGRFTALAVAAGALATYRNRRLAENARRYDLPG